VRPNWVVLDADGKQVGERCLTYAEAFAVKPAGGSVTFQPETDA